MWAIEGLGPVEHFDDLVECKNKSILDDSEAEAEAEAYCINDGLKCAKTSDSPKVAMLCV